MDQFTMPQLASCAPHTFAEPAIFGTEILAIEAHLVQNHSLAILEDRHDARRALSLNFCNVTVSYTHPGQNDNVVVQTWLPLDDWNGRLQGSGGGGFVAGLFPLGLTGAVAENYAVVSTDAGLGGSTPSQIASWGLTSPGNANLYLLNNFGSRSLNESAYIGKSMVEQFYGEPPRRSYWNGCSTGGRQGLMLAQRYPDAYDGILAAAPAIYFDQFVALEPWLQVTMNEMKIYPPRCELQAITRAAISACDPDDGVVDGVISEPESCNFDPTTMLGRRIECEDLGRQVEISQAAVEVVRSAWRGPQAPDGTSLWPGLYQETPLTGSPLTLADVICDEDGSCRGSMFPISQAYVETFIYGGQHPEFSELTQDDLYHAYRISVQQYSSLLGTGDPDLRDFAGKGGKVITWHGYADTVIPPNGTRNYYNHVRSVVPDTESFFRHFEAPGVEHCFGGPGPYPGDALEKLVKWVEEGKAPDTLHGTSVPDADGKIYRRPICAYPRRAKYDGKGDAHSAESYSCD